VIAWGYAIIQGPEHVRSKFRSNIWLIFNWRQVLEARRQVQLLRRVNDKTLLDRFSYQLNFTNTTKPWIAAILSTIFNPLVFIWKWVCRVIVIW